MSRFEAWTDCNITGVSSSPIAPRWVIAATIVSLILLMVAAVGWQSGLIRGGLLLIAFATLLLLFLRTWSVVTARARQQLLLRNDWSDGTRLALLTAVFLLIPLAGGVSLYELVLELDALDHL